MHHSKAQLIVGAGIGVLALLGFVVSFLRPSSVPLEERVDAFFADAAATAHYADVDAKVEALEKIRQDPAFARLPDTRRAQVEARLKELQEYQAFARQLAEVPAPRTAQNEEQLAAIRKQLAELRFPPGYDWAKTDVGLQLGELELDLKALEGALHDTRRGYLQVVDAGKDVLRHDEASQLPQRARQVLDRAEKLPDPERDAAKPISGSARVTYGQVFQFAGVKDALREWVKVREQLKPLTLSSKP